jgi:hypothetical protein
MNGGNFLNSIVSPRSAVALSALTVIGVASTAKVGIAAIIVSATTRQNKIAVIRLFMTKLLSKKYNIFSTPPPDSPLAIQGAGIEDKDRKLRSFYHNVFPLI